MIPDQSHIMKKRHPITDIIRIVQVESDADRIHVHHQVPVRKQYPFRITGATRGELNKCKIIRFQNGFRIIPVTIQFCNMLYFIYRKVARVLYFLTHENIRTLQDLIYFHQFHDGRVVSREGHGRLKDGRNHPQQKTAPEKFDGFLIILCCNYYFIPLFQPHFFETGSNHLCLDK